MKRLLSRLTAVAAVTAALSMTAANSAYATHAVGEGTVVGSGSISPGLTLVPTNQSVTFTGTLVGTFTVDGAVWAGTANCTFSGTGVAETDAQGQGTVSGSCTAAVSATSSFTASCNLRYTRVGLVVTISGSCSVNVGGRSATVTVTGAFVFEPTTANPVTSYLLQGEVVGYHAA